MDFKDANGKPIDPKQIAEGIGKFIDALCDSMEHIYFVINEYGQVLANTVSTSERETLARYRDFNGDSEPADRGCAVLRIDRNLVVLPLENSEHVSGAKRVWECLQAKAGKNDSGTP